MRQNKKIAIALITLSILIILLTPYIFFTNWWTIRGWTENILRIDPWKDEVVSIGFLSYHILVPYSIALLLGMLGMKLLPIKKDDD